MSGKKNRCPNVDFRDSQGPLIYSLIPEAHPSTGPPIVSSLVHFRPKAEKKKLLHKRERERGRLKNDREQGREQARGVVEGAWLGRVG